MPRLSVVVPVFNGADTLPRCLDALLSQLPQDAELIVVDDASTDGTAELLERYPLVVLRNPVNRGTSASRNRGWQAARAPLVAFVDADVVLLPGALEALEATLERAPELSGANGLLALDLSTPGLVSSFVNTSIHYQHLQHGDRVASSFTSICIFRREALEAMGGWEERWYSRYADDVATRYSLPAGALGLSREAQGDHLKRVRARGLFKHRFNVGHFWVQSTLAHWGTVRERPGLAVLALRFPLNTLGGGLLLLAAPTTLLHPPSGMALGSAAGAVFVTANARFVAFTLKHRGLREAAAAVPLSALEGVGCAAGVAWGIVKSSRRWMSRRPAGALNGHT
ncbi:MAG: glycosyltransferase family 2 protein [Alphaproteobacteria bacterium]|nr:glycosyltransferase family 2 protein [Alphaproteobacteria bacterium]MCB9798038.1 glycosyltransferase family 2 protein [Alphaproteobacteria bacterium]